MESSWFGGSIVPLARGPLFVDVVDLVDLVDVVDQLGFVDVH
jgi:hypothetical protein